MGWNHQPISKVDGWFGAIWWVIEFQIQLFWVLRWKRGICVSFGHMPLTLHVWLFDHRRMTLQSNEYFTISHYFALTNGIFALKAPKRKHWNCSGLSKWTALATAVTPFFNISARGFHSSHCAATHRSSILIAIGFTLEFNFRWKLCRCYFVRVSLQHIPAQPPQCKTSYQERWHITTPPQPKTFKMNTLSQGAVSTAWQTIQVHSTFICIFISTFNFVIYIHTYEHTIIQT